MSVEHINIENPDPEDEYSSAQINIEDLADGNQMYVEWGPKGPLLYIYEPEREQPIRYSSVTPASNQLRQ